MSAQVQHENILAVVMPPALEALLPSSLLLPGESASQYARMRGAILNEVGPCTPIQWLLAADLVELSWEIQRYRSLRHHALERYRQQAIEQALCQVDLAGIPGPDQSLAKLEIKRNSQAWRSNAVAAEEIEAHLASYGFNKSAIDLEVYIQAQDLFLLFEDLLRSAQLRRLALIRELRIFQTASNQTKTVKA